MCDYLYLYPTPQIIEYSNTTLTVHYLFSSDLHNKKGGKQYTINKVAIEILSQFNGKKTYDEIISALVHKYGDSYEEIEDKVRGFIDCLTSLYGFEVQKQSQPQLHEIKIYKYNNIYPTVASIELTDKCNARCLHCYGNFAPENINELPLESAFFILESLHEIGIKIIEITGGEPSIYPYTAEIINKAFQIGIPTIMFLSNGIYLSHHLMDTIIQYKDNMFVQIDLHSLKDSYYDWFTQTKGNLSRVKKNIDYLIKNGVRVRICSIFTPQNVDELVDINEWAHEHGAISYAPSIVTSLGRATTKENSNHLFFTTPEALLNFQSQYQAACNKYPGFIQEMVTIDEITRKNCGAITSEISIKTDGSIKLCNMDTGHYFDLGLGNAFTMTIKEIFDQNSDLLNSLMELTLPKIDGEECKLCSLRAFCSNCLLRGILGAKERKGDCLWYQKKVPILLKDRLSQFVTE